VNEDRCTGGQYWRRVIQHERERFSPRFPVSLKVVRELPGALGPQPERAIQCLLVCSD
jgi:hypothetical protein